MQHTTNCPPIATTNRGKALSKNSPPHYPTHPPPNPYKRIPDGTGRVAGGYPFPVAGRRKEKGGRGKGEMRGGWEWKDGRCGGGNGAQSGLKGGGKEGLALIWMIWLIMPRAVQVSGNCIKTMRNKKGSPLPNIGVWDH
jgi:hypothetical protein